MSSDRQVSSKEVKFLLFSTVFAWFVSLTMLWPFIILLKLSSRLRKKISNWNKIFKLKDSEHLREKMFALLSESCPQFACRRLRILELGVKMSNDFKDYSNQHVIDLAYVDLDKREKLKGIPNNIFLRPEANILENNPSSSYDVIISTFYLCSVKNVNSTLENIRRILKPGGKYAFVEHIGYPENSIVFSLQRLLSPLWEMFFNGCSLCRHPLTFLKKSSFATISYRTIYPQKRLPHIRPITYGVCSK
ncbi:thiol S-methyltransferase METTL7B-like isoform X2 [Uloborus diversus]|uniref:thiol S-methyltransferase METTL7B-like isoform X2 n=1 Tax=Uloborus diversus TaxID=327109 RepID=UPI00240A8173|nr:thiol S-methyltransferase METTL7B-like isoform X2 [Uloborus diversus]